MFSHKRNVTTPVANDPTFTHPRKNPFQVKITPSNSERLHTGLVKKLPNISLFSHKWFLFVFNGYWYDDVEERLMELDRRVAEETRILCPPLHRIWRWAELIPDPMDVSVVIVGQDPYTRLGGDSTPMADGLAFSVSREYYRNYRRLPPSLTNVLRAVRKASDPHYDEEDATITSDVCRGNLEHWCRQGVLLLNNTLTAPGGAGTANSHESFGWQFVSDAVIRRLGSICMPHPLVFMLWGRFAQDSKLPLISKHTDGKKQQPFLATHHYVLSTFHPSPLSVNRKGEFPHEQFVVCNKLLVKHGRKPIIWL